MELFTCLHHDQKKNKQTWQDYIFLRDKNLNSFVGEPSQIRPTLSITAPATPLTLNSPFCYRTHRNKVFLITLSYKCPNIGPACHLLELSGSAESTDQR